MNNCMVLIHAKQKTNKGQDMPGFERCIECLNVFLSMSVGAHVPLSRFVCQCPCLCVSGQSMCPCVSIHLYVSVVSLCASVYV